MISVDLVANVIAALIVGALMGWLLRGAVESYAEGKISSYCDVCHDDITDSDAFDVCRKCLDREQNK